MDEREDRGDRRGSVAFAGSRGGQAALVAAVVTAFGGIATAIIQAQQAHGAVGRAAADARVRTDKAYEFSRGQLAEVTARVDVLWDLTTELRRDVHDLGSRGPAVASEPRRTRRARRVLSVPQDITAESPGDDVVANESVGGMEASVAEGISAVQEAIEVHKAAWPENLDELSELSR